MGYLMSLIIPISIYIILLIIGFPYIKKYTEENSSRRTSWYIFLFLMPMIAVIIFYLSEVKPREA